MQHNINNDLTYDGLPVDPVDLHEALSQVGDLHKRLNKDQSECLFKTGRTNSSEWDITLQVIVIKYCVKDLSEQILSLVDQARVLRNHIIHRVAGIKNLPDKTFQDFWKRLEDVLNGLGYAQMNLFNDLKSEEVVPKDEMTKLQKLLQNSRDEIEEDVFIEYRGIIEKMRK